MKAVQQCYTVMDCQMAIHELMRYYGTGDLISEYQDRMHSIYDEQMKFLAYSQKCFMRKNHGKRQKAGQI